MIHISKSYSIKISLTLQLTVFSKYLLVLVVLSFGFSKYFIVLVVLSFGTTYSKIFTRSIAVLDSN